MVHRSVLAVAAGFVLTAAAAVPVAAESATAPEAADSAYGLDEVSREVPARGRVVCPKVEMVRHRGTHLRYHKPVRVYVGFRDRLEKFEKIVHDTAIEVYGRAPRRIVHIGTYNCRRIRRFPTFISEHGLGNAIDIEGFDFGPARGKAERGAVPRQLRRGFKVRVEKHWDGNRGVNALHAKFLRLVTERLVEREDIFTVLLGPAWPGHKNHFHFDVSPWRIVEL